jgi:ABC-type lipoprotein export system ATPase subunit
MSNSLLQIIYLFCIKIKATTMKVKELYIKKYHQFEDFKLNLTYPEGHKLAGQPLNKVCFIGQSGTGKTSLLELIKHFVENHKLGEIYVKPDQTDKSIPIIVYSHLKRGCDEDLEDGFHIIFSSGKKNQIDNNEIENVVSINSEFEFSVLTNTSGIDFKDNENNESISYETQTYYNAYRDNYLMGLATYNYGIQNSDNLKAYFDFIYSIEPLIFYFPCDIPIPKKDTNKSGNLIQDVRSYHGGTRVGRTSTVSKVVNSRIKKLQKKSKKIIDFSSYNVNEIWGTIRQSIVKYRELEIKKSLEIAQIAQKQNVTANEIIKASDNLKKWKKEFPSPVEELANEYLNKIINRFQLEVKTELDFEITEDIESIKIQSVIDKKEIPFEALSTGTKQVILTALPLYGLKPKDSIILFDEPERSLYPDIQTEIVDFYTSMAENSQFFFATHSPLVAASFEPWEIIELKFNEETGNVQQELYYDETKGRHVDNYTIYPQYLTYDGILKKVFDMKKEPNSLRMSELVKLATLESQLKHNNLSPEAKKEKFEEIIKLADQLDWDLK